MKKNPSERGAIGYRRAASGIDRVSEFYPKDILRNPVCQCQTPTWAIEQYAEWYTPLNVHTYICKQAKIEIKQELWQVRRAVCHWYLCLKVLSLIINKIKCCINTRKSIYIIVFILYNIRDILHNASWSEKKKEEEKNTGL